MSGSTIRGMVFDMDGVIIDSHPAHRTAWKQFLQSVDRDVAETELDFILDGRKRDEILRYFLGDLSSEQITEYGDRKNQMLKDMDDQIQPVVGVVEFLCSLRQAGVRVALATSAGLGRAHSTLEGLGLSQYFDTIVTGDDVLSGKPDPSIYRLAAQRMRQAVQNLVAVEDAVAGVEAATTAGMRCIGIAPPSRAGALRAAGADPVVPHFGALSFAKLQEYFCKNSLPRSEATHRAPS